MNDSPTAIEAILSVGKRVWQEGTEVRLIAVDENDPTNRIGNEFTLAEELIDSYQQSVPSKVRSILEWGAEELKIIGMKPSIWTQKGDPKQILVSEAKNWNADCMFVGTRSFDNFLERFRLGSVSTAVVTNAPCSVEVVRPPLGRGTEKAARSGFSPAERVKTTKYFTQGDKKMPDFISRKKLKKKVLDRWENEGGNISASGKKCEADHPPPKRKRKKERRRMTEAS